MSRPGAVKEGVGWVWSGSGLMLMRAMVMMR